MGSATPALPPLFFSEGARIEFPRLIYCMSTESLDTFLFSMTLTGASFVLLPKTMGPSTCLLPAFANATVGEQLLQQQQIQRL